MFGRRLQVQERLTQQIADFLMDRLDPKGVFLNDYMRELGGLPA